MSSVTFVDQWIQGEVPSEAIEDFVAAWHEGAGGESLPEFLGLSDDEYALWVEEPAFLAAILSARRHGLGLEQAVEHLRLTSSAETAARLATLLRSRRV